MKRVPPKAAEGEPAQKQAVAYKMLKKWCTELDRVYQTALWLDSLRQWEESSRVIEVLCVQQV